MRTVQPATWVRSTGFVKLTGVAREDIVLVSRLEGDGCFES